MKLRTDVDLYHSRIAAEPHCSATSIAQVIVDQRSVADERRYVVSGGLFRFRIAF